ncbi:hypothetical protein HA402_008213, partial [Bradysia odoriphaga]
VTMRQLIILLITNTIVTLALPNCANYPSGHFVNDPSNCQAYWYCADANSVPHAANCPVPFNFNEARQLCDHPSNFQCSQTTPLPSLPTPPTSQTPNIPAIPNCENYPPGRFVNDPSSCEAYWYCADANSLPHAANCPASYNFNEVDQLCDHPSNFPC